MGGFTGTYSGDESGTWGAISDFSRFGDFNGLFLADGAPDDEADHLQGNVFLDGDVFLTGTNKELDGTLGVTGNVAGTWVGGVGEGTFTGQRVVAPVPDGEGMLFRGIVMFGIVILMSI